MWRLFYNILLLAVSPVIVAVLLAKQRCRRGLLYRLGLKNSLSGLSGLSGAPGRDRPDRPARPVIWIHAVSLGEVVAVTPLVIELHRRHPECRLVVSTVT
ncbi:MAG TPA: glycosyltransferase N-terminal domain-containing protein, partial [Nitrospiraceae bacterium]|nr:glycosyltransferase N-terminal domain-containing protein [Nitrospiraceae bacterium]